MRTAAASAILMLQAITACASEGDNRAFAVCISVPLPGFGTIYRGHTGRGIAEFLAHGAMVGIAVNSFSKGDKNGGGAALLGATMVMLLSAADAGAPDYTPPAPPVLPPRQPWHSVPASSPRLPTALRDKVVTLVQGEEYVFHLANARAVTGKLVDVSSEEITVESAIGVRVPLSHDDVLDVTEP